MQALQRRIAVEKSFSTTPTDEEFPNNSLLHKVFKRNTVKISASYMPTEHQTKYRLSPQVHFTGTHEYKRIIKIVQQQKTIRQPYEWLRVNGLPKKIHCISGDRNNTRQQT